MLTITRIHKLIDNAQATLDKYEPFLAAQPDNLFYKGIVKNTNEQLQELKSNLTLEKQNREKEIIDLRLVGKPAQVGSLPLDIFAQIVDSFNGFLHHTAKYVAYGSRASQVKYERLIKQQMDLRLDRILPGSTHLIISAKTSPNLFGESAAENGLEQTFKILNVATADDLLHEAANIGTESLKKLDKMLAVGIKNDLEMGLKWNSPENIPHLWKGDKTKMLFLQSSLSEIKNEKPEVVTLSGEVSMLRLKGQLEIQDNDEHKTLINFSEEFLDNVKELKLGDYCTISVLKKTTINTATTSEKSTYELLSISWQNSPKAL